MSIILRPYQQRVYNEIVKNILSGVKSMLVVMPCRSGKTPLAAYIADFVHSQGGRVLFNVHRNILLQQTRKLFNQINLDHGIISPKYLHENKNIQIGSVNTVYRRLDTLDPFNIIISDEAHRDKSATREYILNHFSDSIVIGLTASPCRLSGEPLGDVFEVIVQGPTPGELIELGYLCDYTLYQPPSMINVNGIDINMGEFNQKQLAATTNTRIVTGDAIKQYNRIAPDTQTCIFTCDINHAKSVAEEYRNAGIPAGALHSKLPQKTQENIVNAFVRKDIRAIVNVDMITEGYDCPGIETVQLLRKTMSLALHIQMSTRGMTPAPGKTGCNIIDHVGNSDELGRIDDDFNWSLTEHRTPPMTKEEMDERIPKIKTCLSCWHTYEAYRKCCPLCGGTSNRPPQIIKTIDVDLVLTKNINAEIRKIAGSNKTQGLGINTLIERIEEFKLHNIPNDSKPFIKIQKRIDVLRAKSPEEILKVAIKYDYNIHWVVNRYISVNRLVGNGQAYNLFNSFCEQNNINLRSK